MYSHIPRLTQRIHEAFAASSARMKAAHGTRPVHAGPIHASGTTPPVPAPIKTYEEHQSGAGRTAKIGGIGPSYRASPSQPPVGPHVVPDELERLAGEEIDRMMVDVSAQRFAGAPSTPAQEVERRFGFAQQGRRTEQEVVDADYIQRYAIARREAVVEFNRQLEVGSDQHPFGQFEAIDQWVANGDLTQEEADAYINETREDFINDRVHREVGIRRTVPEPGSLEARYPSSFEDVAGSAGFAGDDPEEFARFSPEVRIRELEGEFHQSLAGLTPNEIYARMNWWRTQLDTDDPEFHLREIAIHRVEQGISDFFSNRDQNPAGSFLVEVERVQDGWELGLSDDPAELSRRSLAWQEDVAIPENQRTAISTVFADYLSNQILELIRHGMDDGKSPAAIMEAAIRAIHGFAGDEFVREYTIAALARVGRERDREFLIQLATDYLDTNHPALRIGPSGHLHIAEGRYDDSRFGNPADIRERVDNAFLLAREGLGLRSLLYHAVTGNSQNTLRAFFDGVTRESAETAANTTVGLAVSPQVMANILDGQLQYMLIDMRNSLVGEEDRIEISADNTWRTGLFEIQEEVFEITEDLLRLKDEFFDPELGWDDHISSDIGSGLGEASINVLIGRGRRLVTRLFNTDRSGSSSSPPAERFFATAEATLELLMAVGETVRHARQHDASESHVVEAATLTLIPALVEVLREDSSVEPFMPASLEAMGEAAFDTIMENWVAHVTYDPDRSLLDGVPAEALQGLSEELVKQALDSMVDGLLNVVGYDGGAQNSSTDGSNGHTRHGMTQTDDNPASVSP